MLLSETNPSPNATINTVIKRETSRQCPEIQEENYQGDLDGQQELHVDFQDSESSGSDEDSMFQEERNDQDDEEEQPSSSGSGGAKYSLRVRRKLIN